MYDVNAVAVTIRTRGPPGCPPRGRARRERQPGVERRARTLKIFAVVDAVVAAQPLVELEDKDTRSFKILLLVGFWHFAGRKRNGARVGGRAYKR